MRLQWLATLTNSLFFTQSMSSRNSFSACSWEYWKVFWIVRISWSLKLSTIVLPRYTIIFTKRVKGKYLSCTSATVIHIQYSKPVLSDTCVKRFIVSSNINFEFPFEHFLCFFALCNPTPVYSDKNSLPEHVRLDRIDCSWLLISYHADSTKPFKKKILYTKLFLPHVTCVFALSHMQMISPYRLVLNSPSQDCTVLCTGIIKKFAR